MPKSEKQIESIKHADKRKIIPTEETRRFMDDELRAEKTMLYPRDPSLDPQLVWKGKDEQDRRDLEVPSVPVFIQEKIHPQAIIDDVKRWADKDAPARELNLFNDFNGVAFEDMIDFYRHEQNWSNRMILGDSLHVMTSLAEREGLKGKLQMIYIDPPYGIKFGSNWQVSTRKREVKDTKVEDVTRQPEQIKAFRDTWELGIHSYLSYLRDRLVVARELLTESGSVFLQMNDEKVHLVRLLLEEIFGSENFVNIIIIKKKSTPQETIGFCEMNDYLLWYAKDKTNLEKTKSLYIKRNFMLETLGEFKYFDKKDKTKQKVLLEDIQKGDIKYEEIYRTHDATTKRHNSEKYKFPLEVNGKVLFPPKSHGWAEEEDGMKKVNKAGRLTGINPSRMYKLYLFDYPISLIHNTWSDVLSEQNQVYVVQTTQRIVDRCILMATNPGDIVLDPTCGSGTTAYVAEQWGRRWITIDTSRVALALARTRLMAAKYPYYLLSDSPEGVKKEAEISGQVPPEYETGGDIKKGFVYKRVPHITLKSIANNGEIDTIHEKWQARLEPVRKKINELAVKNWEEWDIPRSLEEAMERDKGLDSRLRGNDKANVKELDSRLRENDKEKSGNDKIKAKELIKEWWELRRQRQAEIDDSIARNADTETLYDQPYEDKKKIRVSGPFTMESLSPHRRLSVDEKIQRREDGLVLEDVPGVKIQAQERGPDDFGRMIIENLRKAGVQNTYKNERLKFDTLDVFPGEWLQAAGDYTEKDGSTKTAAVCIGPEHGTVSPDLIKEAAIEAVKGAGFDTLIVCGFAFDPIVSEEAKHYGRLTILPAKMNPDLAMGDELLKKTGAGNLFMIFGEPDIEIRRLPDDQLQVEIHGLDVYDPTTGQVRSSSTDDIACWFIDTDYNQQSFFVRHAYFTGADKPYEKLKKALKAEIDESAWSAIYSTVSRPFDKPEHGKIAVKVINHYGDEVLKVYDASETPLNPPCK